MSSRSRGVTNVALSSRSIAWMSRTFFSTSVKSLNRLSSACAASSEFCACWLNCVKKMFFFGIRDRLGMRSLLLWTQKHRADGAVQNVLVIASRRFPAPGPRRVRHQTSFTANSSGYRDGPSTPFGGSALLGDLAADRGDRAGGHDHAEDDEHTDVAQDERIAEGIALDHHRLERLVRVS